MEVACPWTEGDDPADGTTRGSTGAGPLPFSNSLTQHPNSHPINDSNPK